jgi:hypothetical protein
MVSLFVIHISVCVCERVHVHGTNFLWEDMDNHCLVRQVFTRIHGPKNSMQDVTDIVDMFELFFDKDLV